MSNDYSSAIAVALTEYRKDAMPIIDLPFWRRHIPFTLERRRPERLNDSKESALQTLYLLIS